MKPRMRICFDPETELPKLQKWFKDNNHPTRQQVSRLTVKYGPVRPKVFIAQIFLLG
jgi:hypothetical protein